jgi:hypothetical protein
VRRILWIVLLVMSATVVPTRVAGAADTQFTLTSSVTGLYPGADIQVPVQVHNPMPFDVAVHSADVRVGDASAACPATYLRASSFSGDVVAAAHDDATIPIRMRMLASSPDACQGATFSLTFTAAGTPVGSSGDGAGGFAFTGADALGTTLLGVGALTVGTLLVVGRRRPRAPEAS